MAIAQDNFDIFRKNGYEGQISTTEICSVLSRRVEGKLIQFGRAVINGVGKRTCAPVTAATTAAEITGFSVRSMAEFSNTAPANPGNYEVGYDADHIASVLYGGAMFAMCVDGAKKGETVTVITADGDNQGRLTGSAGAGVKLNQVKWVEDVAAGDIGEIRVNGILNV
ncbi:hypothetical protein RJ492_001195 [Pluralibacter gergoviae]|uniref:Uncharacterized protein n=1 Tax=Pluralibacter gergoviae TaxID=61647 RepID=A0AAI9DLE0_PLUGE|nr:hypothetical protein [Pluralibacter gergoviae]EKV9907722.1 hypothetical protein [Pluralibacter gergoviae]EKW7276809.1 hypothetical protein [Pluralibacter gergoviae]ELD4293946.1 hypothetical protein [Pluralibacter gergoviae]ELD4304725.1 hypothetical protein [Pluralibacter gergoviae]